MHAILYEHGGLEPPALQGLGWVEEVSTEDFDGVRIHGQVRLLASRVEHAAEASQARCDESILESAAVVPCTAGPGNAVVSGVALAEVVELLREELDQQDEVGGELACV